MLEEEKHPNKLTMQILTHHDKISSIRLVEFLCRETVTSDLNINDMFIYLNIKVLLPFY